MLFTDLFTSLGMNHSLAWFISQESITIETIANKTGDVTDEVAYLRALRKLTSHIGETMRSKTAERRLHALLELK